MSVLDQYRAFFFLHFVLTVTDFIKNKKDNAEEKPDKGSVNSEHTRGIEALTTGGRSKRPINLKEASTRVLTLYSYVFLIECHKISFSECVRREKLPSL